MDIYCLCYMSDDILLANSNLSLLNKINDFLSKNFDMKDMGETNYVISMKIH